MAASLSQSRQPQRRAEGIDRRAGAVVAGVPVHVAGNRNAAVAQQVRHRFMCVPRVTSSIGLPRRQTGLDVT